MSEDKPSQGSLLQRINKAFGPLAGALILDFVDLATVGPFGIGGFFIGAAVGWWILSENDISKNTRLTLALLAGVYCLVPFTEFIPAATLISAIARLMKKN